MLKRITLRNLFGSVLRIGAALALAELGTLEMGLEANAKGAFTTFNPGQQFGTDAVAINDSGTVTGDYGYTSEQAHGFVRTADGTITSFDPPGSESTLPMSINDSGVIAGFYIGGSKN